LVGYDAVINIAGGSEPLRCGMLDGKLTLIEMNCRWNSSSYSFEITQRLGLQNMCWMVVPGIARDGWCLEDVASSSRYGRRVAGIGNAGGDGLLPLTFGPGGSTQPSKWMIVGQAFDSVLEMYAELVREEVAARVFWARP
jgi:hypothetical protein